MSETFNRSQRSQSITQTSPQVTNVAAVILAGDDKRVNYTITNMPSNGARMFFRIGGTNPTTTDWDFFLDPGDSAFVSSMDGDAADQPLRGITNGASEDVQIAEGF